MYIYSDRYAGRNASESGIHKKKRRSQHKTLRKSRLGTETLHGVSAGQTQVPTVAVETLNVLTRACTGYQYEKRELENPPTDASELISLPVMSWKRFAKDLYDGRIEQLCILSKHKRMTSEAQKLRQLFSGSATESKDTLSAKTKKERFEEQICDSLKASPNYEIRREYRDVLPDEIPAELPQDKGIQHEIDLVPGTKYCVTRQWPLLREQVKAIDDFFESRRKAGQVRESKSPHSAPTFCVKKPQGGWCIVHAALGLRDGFYQILMRESDIPLTAVSTPSAPILAVADQDRPFHVMCDASDFAIGWALMQLDHEGRDRVVYYQSRQLKPAERNYPVHEKELLAVKYALAKFR
ncbi:reverse transcriptase, partial [Phytophthora megakarya]